MPSRFNQPTKTGERVTVSPYESGGLPDESSITVYWLGVDVVQLRTYNRAVARGNCEKKILPDGSKEITEVTVPAPPSEWEPVTLYVTEQAIQMPMLGESLTVPYSVLLELLEKTREGSLLTDRQGGAAVAAALKQQIKDGVRLFDLTLADNRFQQSRKNVSITDLTTEELLEEVRTRGALDVKEIVEEAHLGEGAEELLQHMKGDD